MIPKFPKFKKLELSDKNEIEKHTSKYPPYSDFNFTSLWSWDTSGRRMISELNGNLVVRFTDYCINKPFLSFLGTNKRALTAHSLIEFGAANDLPTTLKLMPEISIEGLEKKGFIIEEDRDNFDYIYDISRLNISAGKEFARKRTIINKFRREHPKTHLKFVDLSHKNIQKDILTMFDVWEKNKLSKGKVIKVAHELDAVKRLCKRADAHDLLVSELLDTGRMLAFSIDGPLHDGYAICHFWKADCQYGRVYDSLMYEKTKYFSTLGLSFINQEQDLGIEGLRISKSAYSHTYLKKFTIRLP